MDLRAKVVVITGASAGLGRAFARTLVLDKKAIVYGLARRTTALTAVQQEIGSGFFPVVCDITNETAVNDAFRHILCLTGSIDVLINNAGLGRFGPLETIATSDWTLQMQTNLDGVFYCTRQVIPVMKKQNMQHGFGGHIINIASIAGLVGNANLSVYNATKFGLRGFSEALMKELRTDGIKVTSICPGSTRTDFGKHSGSRGAPHPMLPEDIASTVVHVLEGSDNYLISEVVMRPLRPRG